MRNKALILGYILLISSIFRLLPLGVAAYYGEQIRYLLLSGGVSFLLGASLIYIAGKVPEEVAVKTEGALFIGAATFIIIPLIGAITYLPHLEMNYIDALFESVSGFTTTGLTVFPTIQDLPRSVILWRSQTQWMGGLGIIAVFLLLFFNFPTSTIYSQQQNIASKKSLYTASGYPKEVGSSITSATRRLVLLYTGITLIGILALTLSKVEVFEAVVLTFSSVSTGGFAATDTFSYGNHQLLILSLLMILGALPFTLYARLIWEDATDLFKNMEVRLFLATFSALFLIGLWATKDIVTTGFQTISALTTTGFSIQDVSTHPHIFTSLLMLAMFAGGCTASTAGGVKQVRIAGMLKSFSWSLRKVSSASSEIINTKLHGKILEDKDLLHIQNFILLYISILVFGSIIFLALDYRFIDSFFISLSALGTVGLSTIPLHDMHVFGKAVLMLQMLMGRLEIFPFLILLRKAAFK